MKPRAAKWRPTKSFWITVAVWVLLLVIFAIMGGLGAWIVLFALFAILTALYTVVSGRRSWLGLPGRKAGGMAVGAGVAVLVLGSVVTATTMPATEPVSQVVPTATTSASPSPSAKSVLFTKCTTAAESKKESGTALTCTVGDDGTLVWMTETRSKELLAERAAVTAKAEAAKAAAKKIEDDKAAAVAAEAAKVAADKAAADQAAADEAARVAAQQAAKPQPAPVQQAPAAPDAYYKNCAAAKAAGAAPLYVGQSGYRLALDGDKDGIACEK
ncbi:excalibur calcium-binding domain-containing protein [Arthrobacter sp. GMC3]|uniref:excalibur calcium-binding domain-containing protein n=1 Tax=Arthrobacter sp. GMC3 TaxID=2058894 RepID=UPI002157BD2F|nr:excalibur calcium-binding domain-containing protein [Arthrobacter sp. GMC3]